MTTVSRKNYFGFLRDHSSSMTGIARAAARDFNGTISAVQEQAISQNQDTIVSVVEIGGTVRRIVTNSNVTALKPIPEGSYRTGGGTPLFDGTGELIDMLESVPDAADPNVSFMIMATTDGEELHSTEWDARRLTAKIRQLQLTDRWTFVFRVPRGYARNLIRLGIPEGNILEWDQTNQGVEIAAQATRDAFAQYYTARSAGATSTKKFYADLSNVTVSDVKSAMKDISADVQLWPVSSKEVGMQIRDFVEKRLKGAPLLKGAAFYQLVKTEPKVQDHKRLIIRDKNSNAIYEGAAARQMMGLPSYGTIRLAPSELGQYDLFIQSTSVNRKVDAGTHVLYYPNVGVPYKEGPSAR